jgi:hypothetical protein
MEYTKEIRKLMARPSLDWRTSAEVLTGETPDSSEYLNFDFYGWVKYHDPVAGVADNVFLGRWLGVAHSIGQAMTYWILKDNGYVVARSTVRPLTQEEERSEIEKTQRLEFQQKIKESVGEFDPDLINTDDHGQNDESIESYATDPEDEDATAIEPTIKDDVAPGPDVLVNAEVLLPHGDWYEIARVIGRKRKADGLFVGRKHQNPILDSRVFVVEFPDGDQKDIMYNMLAEHLYSQVDKDVNQFRLFKEIINHRKKRQRSINQINSV